MGETFPPFRFEQKKRTTSGGRRSTISERIFRKITVPFRLQNSHFRTFSEGGKRRKRDSFEYGPLLAFAKKYDCFADVYVPFEFEPKFPAFFADGEHLLSLKFLGIEESLMLVLGGSELAGR